MILNIFFWFRVYLLHVCIRRTAGYGCQEQSSDWYNQGCQITIPGRDYSECPPLILDERTSRFFHPDGYRSGTVQLRPGEAKIRVQCSYPDFLVVGSSDQRLRSALVTCDKGGLRLVDTANRQRCSQSQQLGVAIESLHGVSCSRAASPVARLNSNSCPANACVEIGFQLSPQDFVAVIEYIAVDVERLQPLVAYARIPASISSRQIDRSAFPLRSGSVFRNVDAARLYSRDYQRRRFYEIFGDDRYCSGNSRLLVEGQLISDRDLYYKVERGSVYFLENIFPGWNCIVYGNWEVSGEIVRALASTTPTGVQVWSGVIDVLALPDSRGYMRKIYLAGQGVVPVPKLLYKYVYDPHTQSGLVLITINDPYLPHGLTSDLLVCPEVTSCRATYPQLSRRERGYTYCCSPRGFAETARALNLPTFPDGSCFELY